MATDLSRAHVVVRGRVQGVGFRYFVSDRAAEAGLDGWVRNRSDGGVECIVQGPRAAVERVLAQLRDGPPWAHVTEVEIDWMAPEDLQGFRVVA